MCFAVVCCKVGMNYVDGGVVLSGLFGLCGGDIFIIVIGSDCLIQQICYN